MEVRGGPGPAPQESQLRSGLLPCILSLAIPCQGGGSSRSHLGAWRALTQGLFPPSGLLRLEELVRGFLISKETLSVRMLDDSRDPTPLLKEIRDDKVSTIIIDANASISHLILRKVGPSRPRL